MKTSGRLYHDQYQYLIGRIGTLSQMLQASQIDAIDASWTDAGTLNFVSKLIDRAILEFDG